MTKILVLVLALIGVMVHLPAVGAQTVTDTIMDAQRKPLGVVVLMADGNLVARARSGTYLGKYDKRSSTTYDANNRVVGKGNQLASLIVQHAAASQPRSDLKLNPNRPGDAAENERLNTISRTNPEYRIGEGQNWYQPKYQHSVMPPGDPNVGRPSPEAEESRRAHVLSTMTQEDRYFALDALQKAASDGVRVVWRNPDSGNSGFFAVDRSHVVPMYFQGAPMSCYTAIMRVDSARVRDYDLQEQTVCLMIHNDVWQTVNARSIYWERPGG